MGPRLDYVPDHFKTKRMCERAVEDEPETLEYVPNHLKTEEMCKEAMRNNPYMLRYVADHFKTQGMCERAFEKYPYELGCVLDHFKTKRMCNEAVHRGPWNLRHVTDWFVTQQRIKLWHDYHYWQNDDRFIKWHNGYQKRKAKKAKIKDELMPIAQHPSRWWDWCVPEGEKKETENIFLITRYAEIKNVLMEEDVEI